MADGDCKPLLSVSQVDRVVAKVNNSMNIPFMSESSEASLIRQAVDTLNGAMEPSLLAIMPPDYVEIIKLCLNEKLSANEKLPLISALFKKNLRDPLAAALNERVDIPVLPESMEEWFLEKAVEEMIDEGVEHTLQRFTDEPVSD
jgi:hypothetical protein|uniref:Uncharacterized protein n=1 Tax=Eutreptiella gymnastica TaxID=73025 RepID=A0A7S4G473_9EUGL